MAEIIVTTTVQLSSGEKAATTTRLTVDMTSTVPGLKIANNATDIEVQLLAGAAQFLFITADRYNPPLTYKVGKKTNPDVVLDAPHLLFGAGAFTLLPEAPKSLFFTNKPAPGPDITLYIVIGQDVTP